MSALLQRVKSLWPEPPWEHDERNLDAVRAQDNPYKIIVCRIFRNWGAQATYYDTTSDEEITLFEYASPQLDTAIRSARAALQPTCKSAARLLGMVTEYRTGVPLPRGVRRSLRNMAVDVEEQMRKHDREDKDYTVYALAQKIRRCAASVGETTSTPKKLENGTVVHEPVRILDLSVPERHALGEELYGTLVEICGYVQLIEEHTRPWRKHHKTQVNFSPDF